MTSFVLDRLARPPGRRLAAALAILGIVLSGLLPRFNVAAAHPGDRVYVDIASSGIAPAHDHRWVICHACKDHLCLEQHAAFDLAPVLAMLPPEVPEIQPPAALIAVAWARAPPAPRARPLPPFDSRGPPVAG